MSDMTHRGCTWWFDFTKSFDPRCLRGGHVHDVSSKMEGWLHFIMLPVPNTNTLDQTERLPACFTCGKLDKKTKQKKTQKSIVWNFANISYCAARLATTCVCFLRGNAAQQFVMEEGRRRSTNSRHITRKTVSLVRVWIWFHELKCVTELTLIISTTNLLSSNS